MKNIDPEWNNFRNYQKIFADPNSILIIRNTLVFVGCAIAITIVLDLFFSILVTYFIKNENISSFFKSLLMIPMITPAVVYSILWIWLLDASSEGVINQFYMSITGNEMPLNWIAQYPMQIVIAATVLTSLAFGAINFSSAIKSIPENQFKAARIDGASEARTFVKIVLPMVKPGIGALAIFTFINSWNDYFMQLIMLSSTSNLTISLGIAKLQAENSTDFGLIMAGAALAAVPIIIIFLIFQKYFTKGIAMGAVKG